METASRYPFTHHPCYSDNRKSLWHRIHLPVAKVCNVKCAFCSHSVGSSCHTSIPGYSNKVMSVEDAIATTRKEIERNQNLRIVAISGPGEPLANHETFETLQRIREEFNDIAICLSTNGILLRENINWLKETRIETISVSMSTTNPNTANKIYEWVRLGDEVARGEIFGLQIIASQLDGIRKAARLGIHVKVNTILIPDINSQDIIPLAREISRAGAILQNIVPLVPNDRFSNYRSPTKRELKEFRRLASTYISQFSHCMQCRSDVVGIPGRDRIL